MWMFRGCLGSWIGFGIRDGRHCSIAGTASSLASVVDSLDMQRIMAKVDTLDQFAAKERVDTCMVRVNPRDGTDVYGQLGWVPKNLAASGFLPGSFSTFGAPWVLRSAACAPRFGSSEWPNIGLGSFVVGLKGTALVVTWPMAWAAGINVNVDDAFSFFGAMHPRQFEGFWNNAAWHCAIDAAQAVWIPYGWSAVAISASFEGKPSAQLLVPFASDRMAGHFSDQALASVIRAMLLQQQVDKGQGSGVHKHFPHYLQWLRTEEQNRAVHQRSDSDDEEQVGTASAGAPSSAKKRRMLKASDAADAVAAASAVAGAGSGPPAALASALGGTDIS